MKTYMRIFSVMVGIYVFLLANNALAALAVGNFTLVSSKRVSRTVYEYTYMAEVSNSDSIGYTDVSATVASGSSNTVIVDEQISFPDVASGASAESNDTFSFRQNRLYPFNWDDLVWTATGTPQTTPVEITIGGIVVGGAPMVGTVNIRDSSDPPQFSYSGIDIEGHYSLAIDSTWQTPCLLWAEGYVGGIHMTMLSYVDLAPDELSKVSNITPATTAIVASAMGAQLEDIDPAVAPIPAPGAVNELKAKVHTVLEDLFAVFTLPPAFDLFETPFVAGEGPDLMYDAESFSTDPENNVAVTSKADPSIELVITDATTPDDAAVLAGDALGAKSAVEQFQDFFNTLYGLYQVARPDLSTLENTILPLCANGLVDTGSYGAADMLAIWDFDPARAPPVGRELVSCSIYRPMQLQHYGALPIHEMPDSYPQGLWVNLTIRQNGRLFNGFTSFVDIGGGNWRYYGNRRPFVSGGRVRARCEKDVSPIGSIVYEHGLHFWSNDVGNSARTQTGMTNMAIFNPAMPAETIDGLNVNCLRMARNNGGLNTEYGITNVHTQYASSFYRHRGDGAANDLDLVALAPQNGKEFVFIGLNDANQPVYAWPNLLGSLPLELEELVVNDNNYFASQISPADIDDIVVPGTTTIDWALPANDNLIPSWSKLEWYNNDWLFNEIYMYNPAHYGPADYNAFLTADHDASAYAAGVRRAFSVVMMVHKANQSEYRASQQHSPWASEAMEARDGQVFFDVQKSYTVDRLSNKLDARIRAVDRSVNRIAADVIVDSAQAEGAGTDQRIEVRLLYQPDEHWFMGDNTELFIASASVEYQNGVLFANGWTWGSRDASGSDLYPIPAPVGSFPFSAPVAFGNSHTLAAEYDAATNSLKIEFDGQVSAFDMSGLPTFDPANFKSAEIRIRVTNINDPDDSGRIQARCDNVKLDGVLYDDFSSGLEVNKWWVHAYE